MKPRLGDRASVVAVIGLLALMLFGAWLITEKKRSNERLSAGLGQRVTEHPPAPDSQSPHSSLGDERGEAGALSQPEAHTPDPDSQRTLTRPPLAVSPPPLWPTLLKGVTVGLVGFVVLRLARAVCARNTASTPEAKQKE